MGEQFVPVDDARGLDQLFARSHEGPVLIFKHSTTCPISAAAYRQVSGLKREVALVVVQKARDVSRAVAERTGVRHESPQALILRGGEVVWTASHWEVTADAVARALAEQEGQGGGGQQGPE